MTLDVCPRVKCSYPQLPFSWLYINLLGMRKYCCKKMDSAKSSIVCWSHVRIDREHGPKEGYDLRLPPLSFLYVFIWDNWMCLLILKLTIIIRNRAFFIFGIKVTPRTYIQSQTQPAGHGAGGGGWWSPSLGLRYCKTHQKHYALSRKPWACSTRKYICLLISLYHQEVRKSKNWHKNYSKTITRC